MSYPMDSGRDHASELCGFHGWLDDDGELSDRAVADLEAWARLEAVRHVLREAVEMSDDEIAALIADTEREGLTLYATPVLTGRPASRETVLGSALTVWLPLCVQVAATGIPAWAALGGLLVIVGGVVYLLRAQ